MTTKLSEFLSRLEEIILTQEKIGSPTAKSRIEDLRSVIPSIRETIKQFPKANDDQVASWAVTVIVACAPWIITDTHSNQKMADYLTSLNVTDLHLSKTAEEIFYGKKSRQTEINTVNRSPHSP